MTENTGGDSGRRSIKEKEFLGRLRVTGLRRSWLYVRAGTELKFLRGDWALKSSIHKRRVWGVRKNWTPRNQA